MGIRKKYNFKSVGEEYLNTREDIENNNIKPPPIGIKTPIELSYSESELLVMHTSLANQISDNFRNLIMTNHGERLGAYDFGANLKELTFELSNEDFEIEAMKRISTATRKYIPYIELSEFGVNYRNIESPNLAVIDIYITYDVPTAGFSGHQIVASIIAGG